MDKEKAYNTLISAYKAAFPDKSGKTVQLDVSKMWREMKKSDNFDEQVKEKLQSLNNTALKKKGKLLSFWAKVPCGKSKLQDNTSQVSSTADIALPKPTIKPSTSESDITKKMEPPKHPCHAQEKIQHQIIVLEEEINELHRKKSLGLLTADDRKLLTKKEVELDKQKKVVKTLQNNQQRQQKLRENRKRTLEEAFANSPELKQKWQKHSKPGRPCLEESQPGILEALVDLATHGCAADDRRRSEKLRTIKTLEEMTTELKHMGFTLSKSAVYLRLLPRNSNTIEGKRHVNTVPVRLIRAENDAHNRHPDSLFAAATIHSLEEIASLLGENEVSFLSQDAKARVPIGITAANKQAPLMMHVEYKVRLPDHDFVKAPGHKLVPDVYAGIIIKSTGHDIGDRKAVGYSGPTYIAIRSAKHSSATAYEHLTDIFQLSKLPDFAPIMLAADGSEKPVRIITCDGGPDENPRYEKVIDCAIQQFIEGNLDAIFVATNAPGRSAFNRVERRMAPLSKELAGVLLPHDHFGSHLNGQGKTVDNDLEQTNFAHAGKVLGEIWSAAVIDGYPVIAKYIDPNENTVAPTKKLPLWKMQHVRESHYMLQVVKCTNRACCSAPRSSYFSLFQKRFIPGPLPLEQSNEYGLRVPAVNIGDSTKFPSVFVRLALHSDTFPRSAASYKEALPYDFACPSLQESLRQRVCKKCSLYHASLKSLNLHKKVCGIRSDTPVADDPIVRIRPMRVAAKRQRELMCVIKYMESTDYEWHDQDEVSTADISLGGEMAVQSGTPVIPTNAKTNPWEEILYY